MDELMDLLSTDESPSGISDKIKDILYSKTAEKVNAIKPEMAASVFDQDVDLDNPENPEAELDSDVNLDQESEEEEEISAENPETAVGTVPSIGKVA